MIAAPCFGGKKLFTSDSCWLPNLPKNFSTTDYADFTDFWLRTTENFPTTNYFFNHEFR